MPKRFNLYCDAAGSHYLLMEPREAGTWLAFKLESRTICFLSSFNLSRLQFVGHAELR